MKPPDLKKTAPAEVGHDQGKGGNFVREDADEIAARRPKHKSSWYEAGRWLYVFGPNAGVVLDLWRWAGEPVPSLRKRGRA